MLTAHICLQVLHVFWALLLAFHHTWRETSCSPKFQKFNAKLEYNTFELRSKGKKKWWSLQYKWTRDQSCDTALNRKQGSQASCACKEKDKIKSSCFLDMEGNWLGVTLAHSVRLTINVSIIRQAIKHNLANLKPKFSNQCLFQNCGGTLSSTPGGGVCSPYIPSNGINTGSAWDEVKCPKSVFASKICSQPISIFPHFTPLCPLSTGLCIRFEKRKLCPG